MSVELEFVSEIALGLIGFEMGSHLRLRGRLGQAPAAVRDNLGLGLLSQAGVAVGLALSVAGR